MPPVATHYYPYLIVGGGMTGDAAARGIRQIDPDRPIGLIGQEADPPYNRPPLSKALWKRGPRPMPLSRIWRQTDSLGVDLILGRSVTRLDAGQHQVVDDQGDIYQYDRLLLATGGSPVTLGINHERIIYFRTLEDYRRLRGLTETGQRFAVIGGGFIGSELAAALAGQGKDVTIIFPETGIGARVLPEAISRYLNQYFQERGVQVMQGRLVRGLEPGEESVSLLTDQGESLRVDAVVAGLGIRPNTALAEFAGLEVSNGILVDATMRTSQPDIYAAGDVANLFNPVLKLRQRLEHEENANLTGLLAGRAMAGQPEPYNALSSVYSTLFEINYDAVGLLDPRQEIVFDWEEPFVKGVAYYLNQAHQVTGVLLWNLNHGLDIARQLITGGEVFQPQDLLKRIR